MPSTTSRAPRWQRPDSAFVPVNPGTLTTSQPGEAVRHSEQHLQPGCQSDAVPVRFRSRGFPVTPSAQDAVLRTAPLKLDVATAGTPVTQTGEGDHPQGSQNILIGNSGGEANLFGNIPGKTYGIDVTVSLATKINSIFRSSTGLVRSAVRHGAPCPPALRLPSGLHWLRPELHPGRAPGGSLKISPGVTSAGFLGSRKVSLTPVGRAVPLMHFAVAARPVRSTGACRPAEQHRHADVQRACRPRGSHPDREPAG